MSGAQRGLAVLEQLVSGETAVTHGALARATGLPKSTLTNVLAELTELGYVAPAGRGYTAGSVLLSLGYRITQRLGIPAQAPSAVHGVLEQLARGTGETTIFSVEVGATPTQAGAVLALDHVESPHPMRYVPGIGDLQPIGQTAAGHVLLAFSGRGAGAIPRETLVKRSPHVLVEVEAIDAELERTRRRGYSLDDRALEGVTSIAAPWTDSAGRLIGAISIVGPTQRLRDLQTSIAASVRDALAGVA
jgi:DNA-binding IclR family transcriptional regulator